MSGEIIDAEFEVLEEEHQELELELHQELEGRGAPLARGAAPARIEDAGLLVTVFVPGSLVTQLGGALARVGSLLELRNGPPLPR